MFTNEQNRKNVSLALMLAAGLSFGTSSSLAESGSEAPDKGSSHRLNNQPGVLFIAPVSGLTTEWHEAPGKTGIPLGEMLTFTVQCTPTASVRWRGAIEINRDASSSTAIYPCLEAGRADVAVHIVDGREVYFDDIVLKVIASDLQQNPPGITKMTLRGKPLGYQDENPSGSEQESHLDAAFGGSIASVKKLGPNAYATSIDRELELYAEIFSGDFSPLIEWRLNGDAFAIGQHASISLSETGYNELAAGPPRNAERFEIEAYSVRISSHQSPDDMQGGAQVFTARTTPSGYENDVTWLAATKYGSAEPPFGQGAQFHVKFLSTEGQNESGGASESFGVKADNVLLWHSSDTEIVRVDRDTRADENVIIIYGAGFAPDENELAVWAGDYAARATILSADDNTIYAWLGASARNALGDINVLQGQKFSAMANRVADKTAALNQTEASLHVSGSVLAANEQFKVNPTFNALEGRYNDGLGGVVFRLPFNWRDGSSYEMDLLFELASGDFVSLRFDGGQFENIARPGSPLTAAKAGALLAMSLNDAMDNLRSPHLGTSIVSQPSADSLLISAPRAVAGTGMLRSMP